MPDLPLGTIGVACGDIARHPGFWMCLQQTDRPSGSPVIVRSGPYLPENLNAITRELRGDWLWTLGDDHLWTKDTLMRMLARMYEDDLDVLAPLCLQRGAPFKPVVYVDKNEDGYLPIDLSRDQPDLVAVRAVGGGGMLVRKRVLDAIEDPWFETGYEQTLLIGEDMSFCDKALAAGFRVHADLTIPFGHISIFEVWPGEDRSLVELNVGGWEFASTRSFIEQGTSE